MVSRARAAGIVALISLAIPSVVQFFGRFVDADWTVLPMRSNGISVRFYMVHFLSLYGILNLLVFLLVVSGGIVLLASPRRPRAGAVLLAVGFLFSLTVFVLFEHPTSTTSVPLGFLVILAGAVIGFTAKPAILTTVPATPAVDPTDKLVRLKALLDSGAITKEEFEEQKRLILKEVLS